MKKLEICICFLLATATCLPRLGARVGSQVGLNLGAKIAQASRVGKLGQLTLKSTLGALSLTASMALFDALQSAMEQKGNSLGLQWLAREKSEYLADTDPIWKRPSAVGGCFVMIFIIVTNLI